MSGSGPVWGLQAGRGRGCPSSGENAMLFSIIILIVIGVVGYFHYLQGFFSAGLSAIMSVIAAVLAIGYHEALGEAINGGKYSDLVAAVSLVSIYALTYILLRTIFDKAVPGNVRFPLLVERIGGASCGVVAGTMAAGVLAIAAQALPFGPNIAMYERYPIIWGKAVVIQAPDKPRADDALYDELDSEKFVRNEPGDALGLWIPADDLVLKLANMVSRPGGSLDAGKPFEAVHPDYLQELFGQRVAIQSGSKHTTMANTVRVEGVYTAAELTQDDPERWRREDRDAGVRGKNNAPGLAALPQPYRPGPGKMVVVIRAQIDRTDADDKSRMTALTPASARLVVRGKNYFPIGTLESARSLYRNVVDDLLFVPESKAVDLVYELPESEALASLTEKATSPKLAEGTFLEIKRFARVMLGEREIARKIEPAGEQVAVVRKSGSGGSQQARGPLTLVEGDPEVVDRILTVINVGVTGDDAKGDTDWGSFALKQRKFIKLEVNPVRTIQFLQQGPATLDELFIPEGYKGMQVTARPSSSAQDKWAWADVVGEFRLSDAAGKRYSPYGVFARVKTDNGQDMMLGRYDYQKPVTSVSSEKAMLPTDVLLFYLVPSGTSLRSVDFRNDVLKGMQFNVP